MQAIIANLLEETLSKDFIVNLKSGPKTYNLAKLGWCWEWSNTKRSIGDCGIKRATAWSDTKKIIRISRYFLNSLPLAEMQDTVLHEAAHALDWEIRKKMNHDWHWRALCRVTGANPSRVCTTPIEKTGISKYTLSCPVCPRETAIHRKLKKNKYCGECVRKRQQWNKMNLIQNY